MEKLTNKTHTEAPQSKKMWLGIVGVMLFLIIGGYFLLNNVQPDTIINYGGNNIDAENIELNTENVIWGSSTIFQNTIAYWDLDTINITGTNGYVIDMVKGYANFTNTTGTPTMAQGILNNGTLTNNGGWIINATAVPNHFNTTRTNFTINFWMNWTGDSLAGTIFYGAADTVYIQMLTTGKLRLDWNGLGPVTMASNTSYDQWHMITIVQNESDQTKKDIYIDGTLNETLTTAGVFDLQAEMLSVDGLVLGRPLDPVDGIIDEIGIWNSSLTSTEVLELYNSGSGVKYSVSEAVVTLNSPSDNYESVNLIDFNCSATIRGATLTNMSLYSNYSGSWSQINTTDITGTINSSEFSNTFTTKGEYLWNCVVCDSDDDCGTATTNRTFEVVGFKKLSESYVSPTTSGVINPFVLNLETNGTQITVAYLNYNGTQVLGSINSTGNDYTLTKNQIAVGVSTSTNVPFYWNVTMADGFNDITTTQNQTVNSIVINSTCDGMESIFNFTIFDEITQAKLNGTSQNTSIKVNLNLYTSDGLTFLSSFFDEFNNTNPVGVCINNNLTTGELYSLDAQIQYGADGYSSEFYNIENYLLNFSTLYQNISLYDLDSTNTQNFRLIVKDSSYLPLDGALVQIERKYLENGTFYISEIPKTDGKGITSASLQLNDVIYNFYIYNDGILISSFLNVLAICQTPLVSSCEIDFNAFQTEITVPDFETGDDLNFTLDYNDTSRIVTSQFVIPSGNPSVMELVVIKEDSLGTAVCSNTLTSSSGILSCAVPANFGNATVVAKLNKDGLEAGKGNIKLDQKSSDIFGVTLVIMSVLVMITLIGVGVSDSPVVTAVFLFVGVILIFAMNIVENTGFIGATATILFLAIAIILVIIKAARRN